MVLKEPRQNAATKKGHVCDAQYNLCGGKDPVAHANAHFWGLNSRRVKSSYQYEKSNEKENRTEGVISSYCFGWFWWEQRAGKKKKRKEKEKKEGGGGGGMYGLLAKAEYPDIIMLVWFVGALPAVKFTVWTSCWAWLVGELDGCAGYR